MEQFSVVKLMNRIDTEGAAYAFLEELRWGNPAHPVCPHCGHEKAYFLTPKTGDSRKTRTGANSERRVWKCAGCRKQFSVLTGTIFHGTKISVRVWVLVIFEMCANKNGISAREIERKYDLTPKSAWFLTQRIREAMKRDPLAGMLAGTIVADETFIGGKPRNKHKEGRKPVGRGGGSGGYTGKTAVLALVHRESGEVRTQVVPDVTGATLRKALDNHIDVANSVLHTDKSKSYVTMGQEFIEHHSVDHSTNEYVKYVPGGHAGTNQAENYFSQLKRSIDGTHHHVSTVHLERYLAEFDYRYSTRKLSDTARMRDLLGRVDGKRLSYRPLTGE
jgi:transposase-like protein